MRSNKPASTFLLMVPSMLIVALARLRWGLCLLSLFFFGAALFVAVAAAEASEQQAFPTRTRCGASTTH